jgi:hypothetical protein
MFSTLDADGNESTGYYMTALIIAPGIRVVPLDDTYEPRQ